MIQTLFDSAPETLCAIGIILATALAVIYISENIWKKNNEQNHSNSKHRNQHSNRRKRHNPNR